MKFSNWLESKKANSIQMPKEKTNKIEIKDAKARYPTGRPNTTMDDRPKRLRTRGSVNKKVIRDYED